MFSKWFDVIEAESAMLAMINTSENHYLHYYDHDTVDAGATLIIMWEGQFDQCGLDNVTNISIKLDAQQQSEAVNSNHVMWKLLLLWSNILLQDIESDRTKY